MTVRTMFEVRSDADKLDWRRQQDADIYSAHALPAMVQEKLLLFHQRMGLIVATYDFLVLEPQRVVASPAAKDEAAASTILERYIFLECNPGGAWLWLEEALQLPISHTVATTLVELVLAKRAAALSEEFPGRVPTTAHTAVRSLNCTE
jgi:hypothetical protein